MNLSSVVPPRNDGEPVGSVKRMTLMEEKQRSVATMSFAHPFQKLCYVKESSDLPKALLAASGPFICCYDFQNGLVARWPVDEEKGDNFAKSDAQNAYGDDERPAKRQRLSGDGDGLLSRQESEESIEIISERVKGQRRKPKPAPTIKLPDVSHILSTSDGRHIVVVTTEDKCIRVLERVKGGRLRGISERCMPKRLCAIALTRDGKTIVAGDKFGDVYSLPLFPSEDVSQPVASPEQQDSAPNFKPSASELTVHTKGNLEALRQQQLQKNFKPKKDGLTFEHKLLLGHVSLLTDIAIAEVEGRTGRRQYILTADRDEHIRVSRGVSQAHVIENYCLGHKEFVSKLCILPWQSTTLIAGSGEPSLKVYDWQSGVSTIELLPLQDIKDEIEIHGGEVNFERERPLDHLAVYGIWTMQVSQTQGYVLVALEGLPELFTYFHDGTTFRRSITIPFPGNILDIAVIESIRTIVVSLDTIHLAGLMKRQLKRPLEQVNGIYCSQLIEEAFAIATSDDAAQKDKLFRRNLWRNSDFADAITQSLLTEPAMATVDMEENQKQSKPHNPYSKLGEFLYGLENLRKQRGQEAAEADEGSVEPATNANGPAEAEGADE